MSTPNTSSRMERVDSLMLRGSLRVELKEAARQVLPELESELLQDEEHGPVIQHDRTQILFEGAEEEDRINLLSREGISMGGSHQGTA
jgi:hypothetical protein